ncbi:oligosaccharide flippase family protein [Porticoccaceae bacterium]|nr:oligosaccharide flippase family protein [Porticoccaceae bacterium]
MGDPDSKKKRAIIGSLWTVMGFGGSQFVRLLSNLLLTRLLLPEVFGVMALVQVVLQGLQMLSDAGISTSVVRSNQGDDPDYLNTAWTLQVIRGVLIWFVSCVLAYPMSIIYEAPELLGLIPVVGFSAVIRGLNSSAVLSHRRHIHLKRIIIWQLIGQILTTLITILAVWHYRSIWAIAMGGVVGALISCLLSYKLPKLTPTRFKLDHHAKADILTFGQWIFVASFASFFINKGDVFILGVSLSKAELGVFSIAAIWARLSLDLLLKINGQVMTPIYSMAFRENPSSAIDKIRKARISLLALALPMIWVLVMGSQYIIDLLYDPRYAGAGWMLQILAIGTIAAAITASSANALLVVGDSFGFMLFQLVRGLLLIICMSIGGSQFGIVGLIAGISVSKFVCYPALVVLLRKHSIWLPAIDCFAVGLSVVVLVIGFWWVHG